MHKGKFIEMQTGEGKTLAAVFPAYQLNKVIELFIRVFKKFKGRTSTLNLRYNKNN
ncbi:hypothetical protein KPL44_17475 [Clostridium sp. DSM 17811]|nr:hypothetical protein [Clostridium sp. DSM 17811]